MARGVGILVLLVLVLVLLGVGPGRAAVVVGSPADLEQEAGRLEAELAALRAQTAALRTDVAARREALAREVKGAEETRAEAEAIGVVPEDELAGLPVQIAELDEALASLRGALESMRRSERLRLRLGPDAPIPAEVALQPNQTAQDAGVDGGSPTPKPYERLDMCKDIRIVSQGTKFGGVGDAGMTAWAIPVDIVQRPRQKATIVSSGINGDRAVDLELFNLFSKNGTSSGEINVYVADPDYRAREWAATLPKVLFGLRYMPDAVVGGQTRRTTYSLLYSDAGLALPEPLRPKADHELRVFSLVAFTRTVSSFIIDVMKLDLPPNLHNWVRLIRDIDRIRVNVLLVTFKDGLEVTPAPSLEQTFAAGTPAAATAAPGSQETIDEIVWRLGTDSQWRLYRVDGSARKAYTFLHICTADDPPCTCCRRTVPFLCSLQPPKASG